MKVYISGKISGLSLAKVQANFCTAEWLLRDKGHETVSPLRLCRGVEGDWHKCMLRCIAALSKCQGIYFIDHPEKTDSYGVRIEALWAEKLGLERIDPFNKKNIIKINTK